MTQELLKILITWAPTLLFILVLIFYFLVGVIRGLRKSVIFLIHATFSLVVCAVIFFSIVNSEYMDQIMVTLINYIMNLFGTSVQDLLGCSKEILSLKEMVLDLVLRNTSSEHIFYYIVIDAGVYLSTIIEMIYRIILFVALGILHLIMVFLLSIIYHIFYPVRRRVKRQKIAFENGDASSPYKKRRIMGGLVGVFRGIVVNVF